MQASSCALCSFIFIVFSAWPIASADTFLGRPSLEAAAENSDPALLKRIVKEVEDALGGGFQNTRKRRLDQIEEMLRPTFWALPKNKYGRLDHSAVRYALHRLFVQMHGWFIRGFQGESVNEVWNSSAALQLLPGQQPGLVQEVFEKRVGERGSSLHDVAALASLFEHLIHEDLRLRLQDVFAVSGVPVDATLELADAEPLINLYMIFYIQGYTDITSLPAEHIQMLSENILKIYPVWPKTEQMLQLTRASVVPGATTLTFDDVSRVVEEASHRFYDQVHHGQCQHTKEMLMEMEDGKSGRVRLLDFYRAAIYENKYQFTETIDYLRQIGTLDESDAQVPRVIIPNYVSGQSNCVARTGYHAVCCPDDCEHLFDHLEHVLKRPEATPAEILAWMADGEPNQIPESLVRRLEDIALHHSGQVPLHGRLFAQWMHFAHPQSCVYPHVSGTTYTKTTEEWEEDTGNRAGSTVEEILDWEMQLDKQHQESAARPKKVNSDEATVWWEDVSDMWTMDEELVITRTDKKSPAPKSVDEVGSSESSPAVFLAKVAFLLTAFGVVYAVRANGERDALGKKKSPAGGCYDPYGHKQYV